MTQRDIYGRALPRETDHSKAIAARGDGAIIYPPGRWPCARCGVEWDFTGPDDRRPAQHVCFAPENYQDVACACWGGGPGGWLCCLRVYDRERRFLLQRLVNLLGAQ